MLDEGNNSRIAEWFVITRYCYSTKKAGECLTESDASCTLALDSVPSFGHRQPGHEPSRPFPNAILLQCCGTIVQLWNNSSSPATHEPEYLRLLGGGA